MQFLERLPVGDQLPASEKQLKELQSALKRLEGLYSAVRQTEPGERRDLLEELVSHVQKNLGPHLDALEDEISSMDAFQKLPDEVIEKYNRESAKGESSG